MKKLSINIVLDSLFCLFTTFILFFLIFNYFYPKNASLVLSLTFSLVITLFASNFMMKKNEKNRLIKADCILKEKLMLYLNILKKSEVLNLLLTAFPGTIRNGRIYDNRRKIVYCVKFEFLSVCKTDVVKEFNLLPLNYSLVILTEKIDDDVLLFSQRFNNRINVVCGEQLFMKLKDKNCIPYDKLDDFKLNKPKLQLKNLLKKKTAKKFFLFGAVFTLFSFFVPYKLYYLIVGSLFLFLALITKLFGISDIKS